MQQPRGSARPLHIMMEHRRKSRPSNILLTRDEVNVQQPLMHFSNPLDFLRLPNRPANTFQNIIKDKNITRLKLLRHFVRRQSTTAKCY